MAEHAAGAIALIGTLAMTVAVFGVVRFRDDYVRLHASSKGLVTGTLVVLAGTLATGDPDIVLRAALVAGFLVLTAPVGAHALAERIHRDRAAGAPPRNE